MTKYTTQEPTPETWKALLSVVEPKNGMSQKPKEKPPNKHFSDFLIIKTHGGKVFVRCSFSLVFAKFSVLQNAETQAKRDLTELFLSLLGGPLGCSPSLMAVCEATSCLGGHEDCEVCFETATGTQRCALSYCLQMRPPPVQGGTEDCEVCSLSLRLARSPVPFLLIQREGNKRGDTSRPRTLTRRVAHNGGGCVCSHFLTPVPERKPHCDPQQVRKIDAQTVGGQILCSLFGPSGGPQIGTHMLEPALTVDPASTAFGFL